MAQAHGLAGTSRWAFVELSNAGVDRYWVGNVSPIATGNWGMQLPDRVGGSHSEEAVGYPMNEQTMFLVRIDFAEFSGGFTQIKLWLNPPDLTDEESLPEPVFDFMSNYVTYTHLGVAGRYSTDLDEIRIGTTFDSVTPSEVVVDSPEPTLTIALDGDNVVLSWEAAAVGYVLRASGDLAGWTDVSEQPVLVGEMNQVTLPLEHDRHFYRLERQ